MVISVNSTCLSERDSSELWSISPSTVTSMQLHFGYFSLLISLLSFSCYILSECMLVQTRGFAQLVYKSPTRFTEDITDSPKLYKPPTRFAFVKTDSPNHNEAYTRFAVVKSDSSNHYKPLTSFALVKTDSPTLYKPPTHFAVIKTDSPKL